MPSRTARAPETSLYGAVKCFLEAQGFQVKGEICGCDIVAVRQGEPPVLIITELKMSLTLELLLQGVERLRAADAVWLAVQASRRGRDRDRRAHRLCRLLGFGLLAVHPARGSVEILAEPAPYRPRPDLPRRRRLLKEHTTRRGDPTHGGSSRQPIMTAYRQQAMVCAAAMQAGPMRPRELKPGAPDAGRILLRNVYGWFERIEPGLYRLTEAGCDALRRWPAPEHIPPVTTTTTATTASATNVRATKVRAPKANATKASPATTSASPADASSAILDPVRPNV